MVGFIFQTCLLQNKRRAIAVFLSAASLLIGLWFVVAFCNGKNKVVLKVTGKKPIDIYQTIINKENIPIRIDHAAYLGRELQKAYLALRYDLEYVQDDELDFSKKMSN